MVMSDSTALSAIRIAASTGRSMVTRAGASRGPPAPERPNIRPSTTKTRTGMTTVPMTPSGSRTKILISSHVSVSRPLNIRRPSVPDRMAGDVEEHVFQRRSIGAKIRDLDLMIRDTANHPRDQVVPLPTNGEPSVSVGDRFDTWNRAKQRFGGYIRRRDDDGLLGSMAANQLRRRADIDD